ncbi:GNAT family N-acetyltransferase [Serratia sp. UGAL515B_01]|uniref:GNAT family N-acetyltransferase n=1 Tax=Serratia sp. UGAL515B_01 TaxID=2986763 RepID=UPI0029543BD3|nr:GNAT family N-acetyltransferase [Serratia sp. UGAL515B_01]WON77987.1 GNAT family N-acetyltransferase [Serratia sp. UGAL515B_01]
MIRIVKLADYPQHQQQVIDWQWQAFGCDNSRAFFASIVAISLRQEGLPITFIALQGDKPVATVGLWRCDLISRQDLTPWLAALYVEESHRGSGLALQMQQYVQDHSRRAGFKELYLYAEFAGYYERHGWNHIGDALDYPDRPVRLYHRSL